MIATMHAVCAAESILERKVIFWVMRNAPTEGLAGALTKSKKNSTI